MSGPQLKVKSFDISKRLVFEAWERVRANAGAPGVDAVTITEFASKERANLYKLWNRMSSGSYFPGPVRAVEIPKDHGTGVRVLGVLLSDALVERVCVVGGERVGGARLNDRRCDNGAVRPTSELAGEVHGRVAGFGDAGVKALRFASVPAGRP